MGLCIVKASGHAVWPSVWDRSGRACCIRVVWFNLDWDDLHRRCSLHGDRETIGALIFVDTLDGIPPRLDNLGSIVLDQDHAEGIFIVNAHVLWKASSTGKPFQL